MYEYKATVVHVIDGDSVEAAVDLGFSVSVHMQLRLLGIDAPEVVGETKVAGLAATNFLYDLLVPYPTQEKTVIIVTKKDKKEKFGRYLATLYLTVEDKIAGKSVNQTMIDAGHAKSYFGGPR